MTLSTKLAAALALMLAALWVGYTPWQTHQQAVGEARATATYNAAISKQKGEAATLLKAETDKAGAATTALNDFKLKQEKKDVENKSTVAALAAGLRAAAGPAGQLRDPNAVAGCGGGGGGAQGANSTRAGGGAGNGSQGAGVLSADLTGLLLQQAEIADAINIAYASCRADAFNLREVLK